MSSTNLKKGLTCSAFDLFHAGHVAMLEEAKKQCDYLIAALQTNPQIDRPEKNAPLQSVVERYIQLSGCKYIDEIIPYETEEDLLDLMQLLDFNVRIIGDEYREKIIQASSIVLTMALKYTIIVDIIGLQAVN